MKKLLIIAALLGPLAACVDLSTLAVTLDSGTSQSLMSLGTVTVAGSPVEGATVLHFAADSIIRETLTDSVGFYRAYFSPFAPGHRCTVTIAGVTVQAELLDGRQSAVRLLSDAASSCDETNNIVIDFDFPL